MGKAIVVTSGKGGVGKTTITSNVGMGLAQRGKKVCLVDADVGLKNLDIVMGLENRVVYDLLHVIQGEVPLSKALIRDKRCPSLFLLPAAQRCDKQVISEEQMRNLILELKEQFDYVLVDCPAGIEFGFRNAIAGADEAIVVVNPEVSSVRDADRVIGLLGPRDIPARLVINRYRPEMVRKGEMMGKDDVVEILAVPVLAVIPEGPSLIASTNRGEPFILSHPNDRLGRALQNLVDRIEGRNVPLENLEESIIARLKRLLGLREAKVVS